MASLVNVMGTGRSGSTMLHLMIGNGSDSFPCGEISDLYWPMRRHHFRWVCPCTSEPCPVWPKLDGLPKERFHSEAVIRLGVESIVDNSKSLVWVLKNQHWASAEGLDVFNVAIWKSPIELAYSYWKRGRDPMDWRTPFVHYYGRMFSIGLPTMTVSLADLTDSPDATLDRICTLLGLPYSSGRSHFWEREHHHLYGSRSVRDQIRAGTGWTERDRQFPREFEQLAPRISELIGSDDQVQCVLQGLHDRDINNPVSGSSSRDFNHTGLYPWWYYVKRARRFIGRRFPKDPPATWELG